MTTDNGNIMPLIIVGAGICILMVLSSSTTGILFLFDTQSSEPMSYNEEPEPNGPEVNTETTKPSIETQPILASQATNYGDSSFNIDDFKVKLSNRRECVPNSLGDLYFCNLGYMGRDQISFASGGKYVEYVTVNPDKQHGDKWHNYTISGTRADTPSGDSVKHAKLKKTVTEACNDYADTDCSPYTGSADALRCRSIMRQKCLNKAKSSI